jgi:hypothetical protein
MYAIVLIIIVQSKLISNTKSVVYLETSGIR